ncbi:MAG TPA: hypothetical protein ENO02_03250, partial [Epsilonproteobacteria bacterium]|nr:hypothetical protein [Campylobacterota bacterium]
KQWSSYNKKRKRPLYIASFLSVVVVALAVTVYLNDTLSHKLKHMLNGNLNVQVSPVENNLVKEEANVSMGKKDEKPVKIAEVPKMVIEMKPNPYDIASNEPVLETVESLDTPEKADSSSPIEGTADKKIHLDILETSSVTAYKDVESRFYQTHDTDDSLFLAKSYFNRGEYKKAEYWALQTNKVDSNIEESWLLFAHAKAKLGQKQDAIKVLNSYIAKTNSIEAKRLLEQIK